MTFSIGASPIPATFRAKTAAAPAASVTTNSSFARGEEMQFSQTAVNTAPVPAASPARKRTLEEQLRDVGTVKADSGFFSKVWNWMNQPKIESVREFGGSIVHNAPSLIVGASKASKAAKDVAVVGEVAMAGTAAKVASGGMGKAVTAAGSSGAMAVLAKVGAVTGTVGGVLQLLRDLVKGRQGPERAIDQQMLIGGGFLAATGSVIALLGGGVPGAVIGLIGTLIHATGLWRKYRSHKKAADAAAAQAAAPQTPKA
ncbi:MAG: hypothetical protein H7338_23790 [Candidatus Sericytochromatia bacterium]|nr:hypothetical protein [Candidatus Sericytochromatia bacterium]